MWKAIYSRQHSSVGLFCLLVNESACFSPTDCTITQAFKLLTGDVNNIDHLTNNSLLVFVDDATHQAPSTTSCGPPYHKDCTLAGQRIPQTSQGMLR